jgi:hypothetical protein
MKLLLMPSAASFLINAAPFGVGRRPNSTI